MTDDDKRMLMEIDKEEVDLYLRLNLITPKNILNNNEIIFTFLVNEEKQDFVIKINLIGESTEVIILNDI